jgi:hypothetical protein
MARLASTTRAGFRATGRAARSAWGSFKGFVRKYPAFSTAVAAGVTVHLIDRGMAALASTASQVSEKRMAETGTSSPESAAVAIQRETLRALREIVNDLPSSGPVNRHDRRQFLKFVELYHHYLHSHMDDDTREFMVTADQIIGSITRSGLRIEEGANTDTMVRSILSIKDDTEPVESVSADLINTVLLDQTNTPLKPL